VDLVPPNRFFKLSDRFRYLYNVKIPIILFLVSLLVPSIWLHLQESTDQQSKESTGLAGPSARFEILVAGRLEQPFIDGDSMHKGTKRPKCSLEGVQPWVALLILYCACYFLSYKISEACLLFDYARGLRSLVLAALATGVAAVWFEKEASYLAIWNAVCAVALTSVASLLTILVKAIPNLPDTPVRKARSVRMGDLRRFRGAISSGGEPPQLSSELWIEPPGVSLVDKSIHGRVQGSVEELAKTLNDDFTPMDRSDKLAELVRECTVPAPCQLRSISKMFPDSGDPTRKVCEIVLDLRRLWNV
jgi:hypothetical protein